MNKSRDVFDAACEKKIYELEKELLSRMRSSNIPAVAIVSIHFQGGESALVLNSTGSWAVKSVMGSYNISNPLLDKLLEKFALLTSAEFQDKFGRGNQNDYECERQRLCELEKLLKRRRSQLLLNFFGRMLTVTVAFAK